MPLDAQAPGECSLQSSGLCCVCACDPLHDGVCCAPVREGVAGAVYCATVGANGYTCDGEACWIGGHCEGSGGGDPSNPPVIVQYRLDGTERVDLRDDDDAAALTPPAVRYSMVDGVTYTRRVCDGVLLARSFEKRVAGSKALQLSEVIFESSVDHLTANVSMLAGR